jgi:hypothetical protein
MKLKLSLSVLGILLIALSSLAQVTAPIQYEVTSIDYHSRKDTSEIQFYLWDESVYPSSDVFLIEHYPQESLWVFKYRDGGSAEDSEDKSLTFLYLNGGEPSHLLTILDNTFCNTPVITYYFSPQDWVKIEKSEENCWFRVSSTTGSVIVRLGLKRIPDEREGENLSRGG